jgi:hypothetical protein
MQEEFILDINNLNIPTKSDVVYFTVNSKYIKNKPSPVSDAAGNVGNDDSDDERSTEIINDSSDNENDFIRIILDEWLFDAILASPNQRLTWDEVVSKCCTTTSSLLTTWYMVHGPDGLYKYYTSQFTSSNTKIICHDYTTKVTASQNYDTTSRTTASLTTNTKTTNNEYRSDDEYYDNNDVVNEQHEIPNVNVPTSFPNIIIDNRTDFENSSIEELVNVPTSVQSTDTSKHTTHMNDNTPPPVNNNLLSRDSRSTSFDSFLSFSSHLDIATRSTQNDYFDYFLDDDDGIDQESNIVERKTNSCNVSIAFNRQDTQYIQCEKSELEENNIAQPIVDLSLVQSFDIKNNTFKEWMLCSKIGQTWHNDIDSTWKQCIKNWLLKLLESNSTQGLWYNYVQMELWNVFGIEIPDLVLWIENEVPDVSVILNNHDGELYVQYHCIDDPITIIFDAIEDGIDG